MITRRDQPQNAYTRNPQCPGTRVRSPSTVGGFIGVGDTVVIITAFFGAASSGPGPFCGLCSSQQRGSSSELLTPPQDRGGGIAPSLRVALAPLIFSARPLHTLHFTQAHAYPQCFSTEPLTVLPGLVRSSCAFSVAFSKPSVALSLPVQRSLRSSHEPLRGSLRGPYYGP